MHRNGKETCLCDAIFLSCFSSLNLLTSLISAHCAAMARCQQVKRYESAATSVERSGRLRSFILNGVVSTEKTLGAGSYGSVLEVCCNYSCHWDAGCSN